MFAKIVVICRNVALKSFRTLLYFLSSEEVVLLQIFVTTWSRKNLASGEDRTNNRIVGRKVIRWRPNSVGFVIVQIILLLLLFLNNKKKLKSLKPAAVSASAQSANKRWKVCWFISALWNQVKLLLLLKFNCLTWAAQLSSSSSGCCGFRSNLHISFWFFNEAFAHVAFCTSLSLVCRYYVIELIYLYWKLFCYSYAVFHACKCCHIFCVEFCLFVSPRRCR